ncbi:FAD/NAD(P)-binding domain-containing protein [Auricularia subglabra TFB-10046 SS5]|nr:FAD/NAD(P)-binding domain-containing protein [Auricularia subglabra TFB-10046 SS5]
MAESTPPRIAIIGGGPGGLTLLSVLARHGVPATLYERDAGRDARGALGGTLDLHAAAGQAAMRGSYDAEMVEKPEIDRRVLRGLLIDAAPPGSIRWGHAFERAEPAPSGRGWVLTFANGYTTEADLLVGADGARSRVRPLVSPAQPKYTGWTTVELWFHGDAKPELAARVGQGTLFAIGGGKRIAAQCNGDGRVRVYATFPAPQEFVLPTDDPVGAALAQFDGWAPWLRELVAAGERETTFLRPMVILPPGHRWPHRAGVTLVGDAMSLMSTFAGKGANVAMLAGLVLGESIAKARGGSWEELDAAVAQYEVKISAQAGKAAEESAANMKNVYQAHG